MRLRAHLAPVIRCLYFCLYTQLDIGRPSFYDAASFSSLDQSEFCSLWFFLLWLLCIAVFVIIDFVVIVVVVFVVVLA